jgi:hypothetical protein
MTDVNGAYPEASPADVALLDDTLADNPFGRTSYLTKQMHASFLRRLRSTAGRVPAADDLLVALERASAQARYRVLGDTVVRRAIQHAWRRAEGVRDDGLSPVTCDEVFAATRRWLETGGTTGFGLRAHPDTGARADLLWTGEGVLPVFADSFEHLTTDNYQVAVRPTAVTEPDRDTFERGAQLVADLLPATARSVFEHVHLVAVMPPEGEWAGRMSSSEFRLSGTVFLNRHILANHWSVAEHLFHEALHQQLYDFRHSHSLLVPDFNRSDMPTVSSPWNVPGNNEWDVFRSLAAFHVYIHLALLSGAARLRAEELRPRYGEQSPTAKMVKPETALSRARYLREQLVDGPLRDELGPGGARFVSWFGSVLDALDSAPPPPGTITHLLLDRYRSEGRMVLSLLTAGDDRASLFEPLRRLADNEVEHARQVLTMLGARRDLAGLDDSLSAILAMDDPRLEFGRIRGLISQTMLRLSVDGYRLAPDKKPDEVVAQMVESSSQTLAALTATS